MELVRKKKANINLNIAPLIDIVFLLLIFFMLSSKFIVDKGITIKLPDSQTASEVKKDITIYIEKNGTLSLNGKEVRMKNLQNELTSLLKGRSNMNVIIKADRELPLQKGISVIDAAKKAGASGVIISTKDPRP